LIHAGLAAAVLAFILWSLPGAVGMYVLSLVVQKIPDKLPPIVYALLSGMNASTVGIIALAAVQLAEKAIKDRITRILVIFGACAGLCYNAIWYFPALIVIGGATTVIWDVWLGRKAGKIRASYLAKRRRTRNEDGDAEETTVIQDAPAAELLQLERPAAVKRRTQAVPMVNTTYHIMPVDNGMILDNSSALHGVNGIAGATPATDSQTHNIPVRVGLSLIAGFLLSFIAVMVIRGTIDARALAFDLFANMYLAGTYFIVQTASASDELRLWALDCLLIYVLTSYLKP
jgi:hypothetical protein